MTKGMALTCRTTYKEKYFILGNIPRMVAESVLRTSGSSGLSRPYSWEQNTKLQEHGLDLHVLKIPFCFLIPQDCQVGGMLGDVGQRVQSCNFVDKSG